MPLHVWCYQVLSKPHVHMLGNSKAQSLNITPLLKEVCTLASIYSMLAQALIVIRWTSTTYIAIVCTIPDGICHVTTFSYMHIAGSSRSQRPAHGSPVY